MSEYLNTDDALRCLKDNNISYKGKNTIDVDSYVRGYSEICAFLSNETESREALDRISSYLWNLYRNEKSATNKFTRALSGAAATLGYQYRAGLTYETDYVTKPIKYLLTGGDPELGYFLRNKLFWKDSMDSYHGEHSHSLQWLAISNGLRAGANGIPIPNLYAESGNFQMKGKDGPVYLWGWLADCFPINRSTIADKLHNGDETSTTSFRSPQNITTYLLNSNNGAPIEGHFVSNYLYYRYMKRKWLEFKMHTPTTEENAKGVTEPYLVPKFGGDLKHHPSSKSDFTGKWKQSGRVSSRYIRQTDATDSEKEKMGVAMKFHGMTGLLYNL